MALISLTIKARRGKPVNQVQLIDTDDIMTPVIPANGGLDSSFVLSERKKGHFSNSNDLVASETYVVDETVQEVTALSSSMFSATVTAQNSKATTPNVVMGFSTHLIAGRVEPNGGGAKFSYQEGGNPALILFQVSDSLSSIASQTTPSGGGGGGGTASSISFVPNGDISSNNVQNAIVEVRDDADTKLAFKLDKASNLSDLANAGTARTNLGLGGAAVLNVGATTGTVRAGDDLRFKDLSSYRKTGTTTLERWYSNAVVGYTPTAAPYAGNILRGIPIVISDNQSWDRIGLEVTTIGSAGSVIRLGLYDSVNNIPTNLIADYETVPGDSLGIKTIVISQTLTPGLYFIALNHNSTTNIFIRSVPNDSCPPVLGLPATFGATLVANSITSPLTYTTMPSTFPTSGMVAYGGSYAPDIRVRLLQI